MSDWSHASGRRLQKELATSQDKKRLSTTLLEKEGKWSRCKVEMVPEPCVALTLQEQLWSLLPS